MTVYNRLSSSKNTIKVVHVLYIQVLTSNLGYLWRVPRVAALKSHSSFYIFEHRQELMMFGVNYVSLNAIAHEISEFL